ncbi:MAG TPA: plastocyanin/azurin family copper-binding protein [Candidatus Saccharimonas sp.]|nr:plastocyanin/azurin family copper-binding protein [Candidatus Saccharimonas sp.]
MKKYIIIAIVAVVVVGGGIAFVMSMHSNQTSGSGASNSQGTPVADVTDMTGQKQAAVTMHDLSFSPANIKIKKGTTVTWTNQDTVAHNVVAADAGNTGGLPTDAATFGHGGTFSFTFNQTGTFSYLCIPHRAFMHGSVQVVD